MKPSGIEWIGDIPDDWEVRRGKYTLDLLMRPIRDNDEIITCFRDGQVTRRSNRREDGFTFADKEIGYQGILKGDLVIHGMDGFAGAIGISDSDGKGSPVLNVCRPKNGSDTRYINYYLRTLALQNVFIALSTGIRERSCDLRWKKIAELLFTIPPLKTQQRIADYLDEKCGEIDATIAKQKEIIEKLKAYKQSLISETVTKGLDKSAPLKPSGIDYLGDIPAHWEVKRIKELFSFGKGLPISKEDLIENGVPVINYGQIHSKDNNGTSIKDSLIRYVDLNYKNTNMTSLVESGDFIFADTSEDLDGCGNCIYVDSKYPIFAGYHCIILRSIKRNSSKYLAYLFQMDAWRTQIRRDVTGVKVFSISKKILGKSYILFPPRYEQECIVNYLQEKCNEIDVIINKKQNIIQKLDAYKKSLIFECVTGKQKI